MSGITSALPLMLSVFVSSIACPKSMTRATLCAFVEKSSALPLAYLETRLVKSPYVYSPKSGKRRWCPQLARLASERPSNAVSAMSAMSARSVPFFEHQSPYFEPCSTQSCLSRRLVVY